MRWYLSTNFFIVDINKVCIEKKSGTKHHLDDDYFIMMLLLLWLQLQALCFIFRLDSIYFEISKFRKNLCRYINMLSQGSSTTRIAILSAKYKKTAFILCLYSCFMIGIIQ